MSHKHYKRKPGQSRLLWKEHLKRRRAIEKAIKDFLLFPCMETLAEAFRNLGDTISTRLCGIMEEIGKSFREILTNYEQDGEQHEYHL